MFSPVPSEVDFVELERQRLVWWEQEGILARYLHRNDQSQQRFSFLDGPITANNPMAVHHAWGRTLKDLYQRFYNMRGFKQRFQNGFDNQGLWVEVEVEKKLGFKTKKDIESYGIDKFVEACKEHTQHFAGVQVRQSQRLGYFMDWGNDYYTMSAENNYAIWHFLKVCWQKGWLYKGRDSVPWCPRCGTAISQHEILTEEYQELTHDSIYLELPIEDRPEERFLVWTTTPWTIPGNVALAVNPGLDYQLIRGETGLQFWLAKALVPSVFGARGEVVREIKGQELVGLRYQGPFDDLEAVRAARRENEATFHTVVPSEELVKEDEGTGIVHIAPGCGGEDFDLGQKEKLPILPVIDEAANYLLGFGDLTGQNAKDDPRLVLDHPFLKAAVGQPAADFIFDIKPFTHRYPTCWRCKSELVWRVVDEWYIGMDRGEGSLRQRLLRLPEQIRWIPSFGRERELDWLQHMEDWLISKKRYWGLALPIWECSCGHFEVIGSFEELKERAAEGWEKFEGQTPHRPWVDAVKIKCRQCGKLASRILDVGNPWLDAGIVAYSTLKYFSDRNYWQEWFPADLVLECFPGQFKNWFYSLLAMSAALENRPPYKALLGHEIVVDEQGEEMHKSKGNAIWFDEAAEKMGVDVMRWLYVTQNTSLRLRFGYHQADEVRRRFFLILWNCYKFLVDKAGESNWRGELGGVVAKNHLDRWLVSRRENLVRLVGARLSDYDHVTAAKAIEDFVIKDLSTWYVRLSRDRLGKASEEAVDRAAGLQTFHQTLLILVKLMAPLTPFLAEEIYQNLSSEGGSVSVHLAEWPTADESAIDLELEGKMQTVRELAEEIHATRKQAQIKVRQPLSNYYVFDHQRQQLLSGERELIDLMLTEVNLKELVFTKQAKDLKVDLEKHEVQLSESGQGALRISLSEELAVEGWAREMMRTIQKLRKEKGLHFGDRVRVTYPRTDEYQKAARKYKRAICQKTACDQLIEGDTWQVTEVN